MAYEVLKYNEFRPEIDIWSFGVLMWEVFQLGLARPYGQYKSERIFLAIIIQSYK